MSEPVTICGKCGKPIPAGEACPCDGFEAWWERVGCRMVGDAKDYARAGFHAGQLDPIHPQIVRGFELLHLRAEQECEWAEEEKHAAMAAGGFV